MAKFEDLKISMHLGIGVIDTQSDEVYLHTWIDKESYESMTESEKEKRIGEMVEDWANNYIDIGWDVK